VLGLVLAAGRAARMGRAKQLAELAGRPLLEHALAAMSAAPVDDLVVVLGAHAEEVLARVDLHRARPLLVADWEQGMGRVIAAALAALEEPGAWGAVVIALGDQPLVGPTVVGRLVEAWRRGAGPVVSAAYHGRIGNPKLFDRAVVGRLGGLAGDEGARGLLARHPEWVAAVEVGRLGSDLDVDDEAGLARARDVLAARRGSQAAGGRSDNPTDGADDGGGGRG
jgi:CTP:molybdopterin cytidylyltransferase MocA